MDLEKLDILINVYQEKLEYYKDLELIEKLLEQDISLFYLNKNWCESMDGYINSDLIHNEESITINRLALKKVKEKNKQYQKRIEN